MVRERVASDQAGIVVVDSAIRAAGWHLIGRAVRLGSVVPRARFETSLPSRRPSRAGCPVRVPLQRVPNHAFVPIMAPSLLASCWVAEATATSANDNATKPAPGRPRSSLRDLLFLAVLVATVAGAFWSGRQNASQRVIVVPEAADARSRVT